MGIFPRKTSLASFPENDSPRHHISAQKIFFVSCRKGEERPSLNSILERLGFSVLQIDTLSSRGFRKGAIKVRNVKPLICFIRQELNRPHHFFEQKQQVGKSCKDKENYNTEERFKRMSKSPHFEIKLIISDLLLGNTSKRDDDNHGWHHTIDSIFCNTIALVNEAFTNLSFFSIRVSTACSCSVFNFTPRKFSVHTRCKTSTTEAAIFVYRNLARAVGIQMRSLTDSCHRIKNRPIKSLRHQCAGHQKFNMKPLQSLFSLWLAPPLFADCGFAALSSQLRCLPFVDFSAKERLLAVYRQLCSRDSRQHFKR